MTQVRESHEGHSPKACVTRLSAVIISQVKMNSSLIHFCDLIQWRRCENRTRGIAQRLAPQDFLRLSTNAVIKILKYLHFWHSFKFLKVL